jgi:hypothetical protein
MSFLTLREHQQKPPHEDVSEDGEVRWSHMRRKPGKVKSANSFGFSGRTGSPMVMPLTPAGN